jgi:hypothetical protein
MKFPVQIEMNGETYRILALTEIGGMSMRGNGKPEIDYLCRAEWLSPYGWKKLRNINILGELRQMLDSG